MTSNRFYIRILGISKAPHSFPYFVPDTSLQEIAYQTYVNGVATSLNKSRKGC